MKMLHAQNVFVEWYCLTEQWTKQMLPGLAGVWATMSSPTSTPGSRKRGRNATPGTRKFTCWMQVASWWCVFFLLGWLVQCVCMWCQRAARAPYLLRLSDAGARTPRLGIWCPCPPRLLQTASVQPPPRTPRCSPVLVPQVQTTRRLEDSIGIVLWDSVCKLRCRLGVLFCLFFFAVFLTVLPNEVDMSSPLIYGTPSSRVEGTPRSGVRGTPARQRPDLGSVRKAPQVDLHSEPVSERLNSILRIVVVFFFSKLKRTLRCINIIMGIKWIIHSRLMWVSLNEIVSPVSIQSKHMVVAIYTIMCNNK